MKSVVKLLSDIIPTELCILLESQPDGVVEYVEPGFSLSLLKRQGDRINKARTRAAFAEEGSLKQYLLATVELLESAGEESNSPVWQGYFIKAATRFEFVLVPHLSRRVVGEFDIR